jgi:ATP-dependent Clp protease ATP-binding subunit ClpC
MEESLHRRIVGQNEAVRAVARATRRSRAGLKNPRRPVGSFIFLGPTGVGKTEVARGLAEFLFGDERALVRFDMSEYMEKHAIAKMIGSPPGYVGYEEGGQLTERIKRKPYSILLLDEIEKAHPDILNILLQVMEDGQITDAFGDTIDFKNSLLVMTSNIGSQLIQKSRTLGFRSQEDRQADYSERREIVQRELKNSLNPEFINRVDEIIVFDALSDDDLMAITRLMIGQLNASLAEKGIRLSLTDEAYRWLIDRTCGDRSYGARPLRRAIQKNIEDVLSESIILGQLPGKGEIEIFVDREELALREPIEVAH